MIYKEVAILIGATLSHIFISPNEVFGDIMVLALPPPVDPDDVNTHFQILYEGRYPPDVNAIEIRYPPMTRTIAFATK